MAPADRQHLIARSRSVPKCATWLALAALAVLAGCLNPMPDDDPSRYDAVSPAENGADPPGSLPVQPSLPPAPADSDSNSSSEEGADPGAEPVDAGAGAADARAGSDAGADAGGSGGVAAPGSSCSASPSAGAMQ